MYCIKCGVELADSEEFCPLCGLKVYHPELKRPQNVEYPYPKIEIVNEKVSRFGLMTVLTTIFLLPIILTFICDLSINGTVTWSGYVIGGMITAYIVFILPIWFKRPNPVIFTPTAFAVIALFVLYIDLINNGGWFLYFALPLIAGIALIVTTVVTLMRYLRRGALYIIGGSFIAFGGFMVLVDHLINVTFNTKRGIFWSWYPMIVFTLLGLCLYSWLYVSPSRSR